MTFVETLQSRNIRYRASSERGELSLCCPFCIERGEPTSDTKFKLGLNYLTREGHCFRCDWRSRDAVRDYMIKAIQIEDEILEDSVAIVKPPPPQLPEDFQLLYNVGESDEIVYEAYKYLKDRGISSLTMRRKQIGVSLTGRYAYRVLFPVLWRNKLKGIVARDFTGTAQAKYLNSVGDKYLYNLPTKCQSVILAEGVFKVLAIEKAIGVPAAALLGHSITDKMIKQLKHTSCEEVTIWPDPDSVGIKGALNVADQLHDFTKVFIISPVPSKQADELKASEIAHRYKARVPYNWALHQKIAAASAFKRSS